MDSNQRITELRRQFPHSLLRRGDALRLLREIGLTRYTLEQWVISPPRPLPIRVIIGSGRQHRYLRDRILDYALNLSPQTP